MGTLQPTAAQIKEMVAAPDDGPVVMLNLLKFKKTTGAGEPGRKAYENYGRAVLPMLKEIGARVLWLGAVERVFIGVERDRWDEVLLVEYPSRKAFLGMISRPDYMEAHRFREEALEDSALIATSTVLKGM